MKKLFTETDNIHFKKWWKNSIHESGLGEDIERTVKFYAALAFKAGERSAYQRRKS